MIACLRQAALEGDAEIDRHSPLGNPSYLDLTTSLSDRESPEIVHSDGCALLRSPQRTVFRTIPLPLTATHAAYVVVYFGSDRQSPGNRPLLTTLNGYATLFVGTGKLPCAPRIAAYHSMVCHQYFPVCPKQRPE